MQEKTKKCNDCGVEQSVENFYKSKPNECKSCASEFNKKYYKANKERWLINYQLNREELNEKSRLRYHNVVKVKKAKTNPKTNNI